MRGHSTVKPSAAARLALLLALVVATTASPLGPPSAAQRPENSSAPVSAPLERTAVNISALTPTQTLKTLSLEQRVGQVLMMGVPATGASSTDLSILTKYKVGNVFLKGRSYTGVTATKSVVNKINATVSLSSTGGQKRFIATDQEGGYVQVLQGTGFSDMPTALYQGTWSTTTLRSKATAWAKQLHSAGVNVNLAPVADTVPSADFAPYNSPIGYWHREFGYTSWSVADDVGAFVAGMRAGGIAPVAKHFPGLGRVTKNTDTSSNVKDTITTRYSVYRRPFIRAIAGGTRWVMISNAIYTQIEPNRVGPYSSIIMKSMLRHDLGFTGIVISDDMCNAKQLAAWSYASRARAFFNAGGTMMLCVNAAAIPTIHKSMVALAKSSPSFRAKIDAAALEVLQTRAGQ